MKYFEICKQLPVLLAVIVFLHTGAKACGPNFPNRVLAGGDNYFLTTPVASFRSELERISLQERDALQPLVIPGKKIASGTSTSHGGNFSRHTRDLDQCLSQSGMSEPKRKMICAKYNPVRKYILEYKEYFTCWSQKELVVGLYERQDKKIPEWYLKRWKKQGVLVSDNEMRKFKMPELPSELPMEFKLYLRGAGYFHADEYEKAGCEWLKLLALPESARKHRGVWAEFMLGKIALLGDPRVAEARFQEVRRLSSRGFQDTLDLASSSLGWEAQISLLRKDYDNAINLYLAQHASGDNTAYASLLIVCHDVFADDQVDLGALTHDSVARRVLTAYVLSLENPVSLKSEKWLAEIEMGGLSEVVDVDRLAWIAYRLGNFKQAQRWLDVADKSSLIGKWISSKLYLRNGDVDRAAADLSAIIKHLATLKDDQRIELARMRPGEHCVTNFEQVVHCELGTLMLHSGDYIGALDTLLRSGFWEDAAYVAERVLTADELIGYVDTRHPIPGLCDVTFDFLWIYPRYGKSDDWKTLHLRWLLARRLTRKGRWKEAGNYFPTNVRPYLDIYISAIRSSHEKKLGSSTRAASAWEAAHIARYKGMELLGYELEPDWACRGGQFVGYGYFHACDKTDVFNKATRDEMKRVKASTPALNTRFHYRYIALEHAWRAINLMPDNDIRTAKMLFIAGSWIKGRDVAEGDKFYKALVNRCRKTDIGKEADRIRWFPKKQIDAKLFLAEMLKAK